MSNFCPTKEISNSLIDKYGETQYYNILFDINTKNTDNSLIQQILEENPYIEEISDLFDEYIQRESLVLQANTSDLKDLPQESNFNTTSTNYELTNVSKSLTWIDFLNLSENTLSTIKNELNTNLDNIIFKHLDKIVDKKGDYYSYNNKNYTKNSIKNLILNNTIKLPSDFYKSIMTIDEFKNYYNNITVEIDNNSDLYKDLINQFTSLHNQFYLKVSSNVKRKYPFTNNFIKVDTKVNSYSIKNTGDNKSITFTDIIDNGKIQVLLNDSTSWVVSYKNSQNFNLNDKKPLLKPITIDTTLNLNKIYNSYDTITNEIDLVYKSLLRENPNNDKLLPIVYERVKSFDFNKTSILDYLRAYTPNPNNITDFNSYMKEIFKSNDIFQLDLEKNILNDTLLPKEKERINKIVTGGYKHGFNFQLALLQKELKDIDFNVDFTDISNIDKEIPKRVTKEELDDLLDNNLDFIKYLDILSYNKLIDYSIEKPSDNIRTNSLLKEYLYAVKQLNNKELIYLHSTDNILKNITTDELITDNLDSLYSKLLPFYMQDYVDNTYKIENGKYLHLDLNNHNFDIFEINLSEETKLLENKEILDKNLINRDVRKIIPTELTIIKSIPDTNNLYYNKLSELKDDTLFINNYYKSDKKRSFNNIILNQTIHHIIKDKLNKTNDFRFNFDNIFINLNKDLRDLGLPLLTKNNIISTLFEDYQYSKYIPKSVIDLISNEVNFDFNYLYENKVNLITSRSHNVQNYLPYKNYIKNNYKLSLSEIQEYFDTNFIVKDKFINENNINQFNSLKNLEILDYDEELDLLKEAYKDSSDILKESLNNINIDNKYLIYAFTKSNDFRDSIENDLFDGNIYKVHNKNNEIIYEPITANISEDFIYSYVISESDKKFKYKPIKDFSDTWYEIEENKETVKEQEINLRNINHNSTFLDTYKYFSKLLGKEYSDSIKTDVSLQEQYIKDLNDFFTQKFNINPNFDIFDSIFMLEPFIRKETEDLLSSNGHQKMVEEGLVSYTCKI